MKINVSAKDVIITSRQKALIEKKIAKLKKYVKDEPVKINVTLSDQSSVEKGGIDQSVQIYAVFGKEKIFIEEIDDRLMRAFAVAQKRFERQLSRYHQKKIAKKQQVSGGRLEKIWKAVTRK